MKLLLINIDWDERFAVHRFTLVYLHITERYTHVHNNHCAARFTIRF